MFAITTLSKEYKEALIKMGYILNRRAGIGLEVGLDAWEPTTTGIRVHGYRVVDGVLDTIVDAVNADEI